MSSLLTEEQQRQLEAALEAKRAAALKAAARARASGELTVAPPPASSASLARAASDASSLPALGAAAVGSPPRHNQPHHAAVRSGGTPGDRRPRQGAAGAALTNRGGAKKGGGGGKWTWGRLLAAAGQGGAGANAGGGAAARRRSGSGAGAGADYVRALDRRDPNYDSAEEEEEQQQQQRSRARGRRRSGQGGGAANGNGGSAPATPRGGSNGHGDAEAAAQRIAEGVAQFKAEVGRIVLEFFSSADVADVARSLEELVYEAEDLEEQAALLAKQQRAAAGGGEEREEREGEDDEEDGAAAVPPPSSAPFVGPSPAALHYFVKTLLREAMDRRDREREAASVLLSALLLMRGSSAGVGGEGGGEGGGGGGGASSTAVLPADQVEKGFATALDQLEDTVLDVPNAAELLATFIARAVVDDVLPPAAVGRLCGGGGGAAAATATATTHNDSPPAGSARAEVKKRVELLLSARHAGERLLRCWGADPAEAGAAAGKGGQGGAKAAAALGGKAATAAAGGACSAAGGGLASAEAIKGRMAAILAEHEDSGDALEAARCLRALGVPFFHHELVKQVARAAMAAAAARDAAAAAASAAASAAATLPQQHDAHRRRHLALLRVLAATGELSPYQLLRGLRRVAEALDDAALDEPRAREAFLEDVLAPLEKEDEEGSGGGPALPLEPDDWAALRAAAAPGAAAAAEAEVAAASAASPQQPFAAVGPGGSRVQAFKADVTAALREYFESADLGECAARLREAAGGQQQQQLGEGGGAAATATTATAGANGHGASSATPTPTTPPLTRGVAHPGLLPLAVKRCVEMALDRRDRERELASRLLAALGPLGLTSAAPPLPSELESGFARLLAGADDLVLDCPDAVRLLALFLGRAVVDEAVPPAFLHKVLASLPDGGLGVAVVSATGAMLSARHGAERLSECWHGASRGWGGGGEEEEEEGEGAGGAGAAGNGSAAPMPLSAVRRALRAAVEEYFESSHSASEVERCLSDLAVPHYHHELVKLLLEACFSRLSSASGGGGGAVAAEDDPAVAAAGDLLAALAASGAVSQTQLAVGLGRVRDRLADEALDAPKAPLALAALLARASREGWLPAAELLPLSAAAAAAE